MAELTIETLKADTLLSRPQAIKLFGFYPAKFTEKNIAALVEVGAKIPEGAAPKTWQIPVGAFAELGWIDPKTFQPTAAPRKPRSANTKSAPVATADLDNLYKEIEAADNEILALSDQLDQAKQRKRAAERSINATKKATLSKLQKEIEARRVAEEQAAAEREELEAELASLT